MFWEVFQIPEIMGATNPVPGYDSNTMNRNLPVTPETNTQIQNVVDPSRVVGPDGRTEQQDNGSLVDSGNIRYDSNFQTFLQRLREAPNLAECLSKLFTAKEGTVVLSGMSEGVAAEMAQAVSMLRMDPDQLLDFLTGQFKTANRFGGAFFALLRSDYARASSDSTRMDILQFLKAYVDYSSKEHLEGNILKNLKGMADAMPQKWSDTLKELTAQTKNPIAAGDRQETLTLLRQEVFPLMSAYVKQTHDLGYARQLLSLLTLDMSRYENGSEENLLQMYHRMVSYGTLKDQLGEIDDPSLLKLLDMNKFPENTPASQFAGRLSAAAACALGGEGSAETQEVFQQLVGAMLVNESVYMPVNHFILPLEWNGKFLFSEMWVDPDAGGEAPSKGRSERTIKILFKMDVQDLGLFDVLLTSAGGKVNLHVACPEKAVPFSERIGQAMQRIIIDNGLTAEAVNVRRMERPVALTEVFPQIFERKNGINVKV